MTNRVVSFLFVLVACTRQEPQPRQPAYVVHEEHGVITGPAVAPVPVMPAPSPIPTKDQPPHVKLKLGHFRNDQFNIGVTIDLLTDATENVADVDPARLRFDGEDKIYKLEGRRGGNGRIDYVREKERVMLQITRDGDVAVYITDPETDRASDAIHMYRDADADPL